MSINDFMPRDSSSKMRKGICVRMLNVCFCTWNRLFRLFRLFRLPWNKCCPQIECARKYLWWLRTFYVEIYRRFIRISRWTKMPFSIRASNDLWNSHMNSHYSMEWAKTLDQRNIIIIIGLFDSIVAKCVPTLVCYMYVYFHLFTWRWNFGLAVWTFMCHLFSGLTFWAIKEFICISVWILCAFEIHGYSQKPVTSNQPFHPF